MRTVEAGNYQLKRKKAPFGISVYYKKEDEDQWFYGFCYTPIDEIVDYIKVFKIFKGILCRNM